MEWQSNLCFLQINNVKYWYEAEKYMTPESQILHEDDMEKLDANAGGCKLDSRCQNCYVIKFILCVCKCLNVVSHSLIYYVTSNRSAKNHSAGLGRSFAYRCGLF